MLCPNCGEKTIVVNTIPYRELGELYRYRKCENCKFKFYTIEVRAPETTGFRSKLREANKLKKYRKGHSG